MTDATRISELNGNVINDSDNENNNSNNNNNNTGNEDIENGIYRLNRDSSIEFYHYNHSCHIQLKWKEI